MILHLFLEFRDKPWDETSATSKYQALKGECLMVLVFFSNLFFVCVRVCVCANT